MRVALFQPDIAGNVGTILRLCACFGVSVDIIEPCGFPFSDKKLKRSGMDYASAVDIKRHVDWESFSNFAKENDSRILLLSSKAEATLYTHEFQSNDIILLGSEGAGVPQHVHDQANVRITIPMQPGFRSLNVAITAGIALSEGLRQTGSFSCA